MNCIKLKLCIGKVFVTAFQFPRSQCNCYPVSDVAIELSFSIRVFAFSVHFHSWLLYNANELTRTLFKD